MNYVVKHNCYNHMAFHFHRAFLYPILFYNFYLLEMQGIWWIQTPTEKQQFAGQTKENQRRNCRKQTVKGQTGGPNMQVTDNMQAGRRRLARPLTLKGKATIWKLRTESCTLCRLITK